jgi:hypothetical protein
MNPEVFTGAIQMLLPHLISLDFVPALGKHGGQPLKRTLFAMVGWSGKSLGYASKRVTPRLPTHQLPFNPQISFLPGPCSNFRIKATMQFRNVCVTILFTSCTLAGQHSLINQKGKLRMSEQNRLTWSASAPANSDEQVYFSYKPGLGLMDIDFHPITERNWAAMRSPSPRSIAKLDVSRNITLDQLEKVLRALSEKGGYRTVEISYEEEKTAPPK